MSETLDLVLKHKWYDMIASGVKTEEYREIKSYWIKRIMKCSKWCCVNCANGVLYCLIPNRCINTYDFCKISGGFTHVRFHRGYTSTTITFDIKRISIGQGREEWGAEKGKKYFVIKLGKRL